MKNSTKIISATTIITLSLLAATAFAQTTTNASTTRAQMRAERLAMASSTRAAKTAQMMNTVTTKSDTEIAARIASLNSLLNKIQGMQKISQTTKDTIASTTQSEIANLTALKAQIDTDTSTTTLKADFQSITASYRIYALIEPQIEILAQADRINTLVGLESTVANKLQTILSQLSAKGMNVNTLQTTLTDANAKIADAENQATTSIARTATLVPDDGNATTAAANKAALQESHSDLQVGILDLETAKTDLQDIVGEIKTLRGSTTATSTAATTTAE